MCLIQITELCPRVALLRSAVQHIGRPETAGLVITSITPALSKHTTCVPCLSVNMSPMFTLSQAVPVPSCAFKQRY